MKVLLWTTSDKTSSASARNAFYGMHQQLKKYGYDVDLNTNKNLNSYKNQNYDIVILHHLRASQIHQIVNRWPKCHIGVSNTGKLGIKPGALSPEEINKSMRYAVNNIDFFVSWSFVWRDKLLKFGKRMYPNIDYESTDNKPIKKHTKKDDIVIGYHGNTVHYKEEFFPNGANALKKLASEYNITLKIITGDATDQPSIKGIKTKFINFDLSTFDKEIQEFDIGICPVISNYTELADPTKHIRNPNRIVTLLAYGIPSITSPIPQSCHDLKNNETVLFAVNEEGWYQAFKKLIDSPELRNKIGHAGRKMVEEKFSADVATNMFIKMLKEEIKYSPCKKDLSLPPVMKSSITQRLKYYWYKI